MERISTFKQKAITMLFALAMMLVGQNAFAQTAIGGSKMNDNEGCEKLVDGLTGTKWGQTWRSTDKLYVILKGSEDIVPGHYYVITGGDTGTYPERNWNTWYIYGGNFASDEEATEDAAGWELIDSKEQVGQLMIPGESGATAEFDISETVTKSYRYFKLVIAQICTLEEGIYMQMSEFNFGMPGEAFAFTALSTGDRSGKVDDGNESALHLVDGFTGSKWGFGSDNVPQNSWLVFKSSQAFKPTFYSMHTANDTGTYGPERNWLEWKIWGGNFSSDAEAVADAPGWVLIDHKINTDGEILPAVNSQEFFLDLSEEVTQEFQYFKVHLLVSGGGFAQMAELALGTDNIFKLKRSIYWKEFAKFDLNVHAYQPYKDAYQEALSNLPMANTSAQMNEALVVLREAQGQITKSVNAYNNYESTVGNYKKDIGKLNTAGKEFFNTYMETNAGPSETYPNGTLLYILENCPLSDEALAEENKFLGTKFEEFASDLTSGAIEATYVPIAGTNGFNAEEGFPSLVDGNRNTKWCTSTSYSGGDPWFIIFQASEPIVPTYYLLTTGNDTGPSGDRNWKNYKIYGGNFANEDAAIAASDDEWVLLDDKQNVGPDQIPAANTTDAYVYMSQPSDTPFEYFKIVVSNAYSGDLIQMAEFSFQNNANFYKSRQEYVAEFSDINFDELMVQQTLIDQYNETLALMKVATTLDELGSYFTQMNTLRNNVTSNDLAYQDYKATIEDIAVNWLDEITEFDPQMADYFDSDNALEPSGVFPNGNFAYILQNLPLSTSAVRTEKDYWLAYVASLEDARPIVLDGNTAAADGEKWPMLIDDNEETKWCGGIPEGGSFLIFKYLIPQKPFFYSLMTGNDTEGNPGRNWKSWKIYGGNFANNGEAARDAEGWVLLDNHEEIGPDRLPAKNFETTYFGFTEGISEAYQYFRVEVSSAYSGTLIQMTELRFLEEDQFMDIRFDYADLVDEFSADVIADQNLLDEYEEAYSSVAEAEDMESLIANYLAAVELQNKITASAQIYEQYKNTVEEIATFINESKLEDSEVLNLLNSYINEEYESGELFPNGSYPIIYGDHILNDSTIAAEIDYVRDMQTAAVRAGYGEGTDITSLVVNPDFKKAQYTNGTTIAEFEGWSGTAYTYGTNEEGTMSAAENVHQRTNISQTITGLKNGVYELRMNAGYRPCGDIYSTNYAAQLYANENSVYVQSVIEDMIPIEEAQDRVNCWLGTTSDKPILNEESDTIGYVIWGVQSCCYAFAAGRYENATVVNVTDGTLTIGIKDPGTTMTDNEWLGFGNTRLIYRGELGSEESIEGIDNALASATARANTLLEWETSLSGDDYLQKPNYSQAEREELRTAIEETQSAKTAAEKYALVQKFTEIFNSIYETKKAYITVFEAEQNVYTKWIQHNTLMTIDQSDAFNEAIIEVEDGLYEGAFSAEDALAIKAKLYADYPDYFEYNKSLVQSSSVSVEETAPFEYEMTINGNLPFVTMNGLYEDLAADKTILRLEYKSDADLINGFFYFDNNTAHSINYEALPATAEWKTVYFDITEARETWKWGSKDNTLRWAMTTNKEQKINARNILVLTTAEMEAEGGSITGINVVNSDTPMLQQTGIYTITGVRVEKPTRGLYIINGKKVLVK